MEGPAREPRGGGVNAPSPVSTHKRRVVDNAGGRSRAAAGHPPTVHDITAAQKGIGQPLGVGFQRWRPPREDRSPRRGGRRQERLLGPLDDAFADVETSNHSPFYTKPTYLLPLRRTTACAYPSMREVSGGCQGGTIGLCMGLLGYFSGVNRRSASRSALRSVKTPP